MVTFLDSLICYFGGCGCGAGFFFSNILIRCCTGFRCEGGCCPGVGVAWRERRATDGRHPQPQEQVAPRHRPGRHSRCRAEGSSSTKADSPAAGPSSSKRDGLGSTITWSASHTYVEASSSPNRPPPDQDGISLRRRRTWQGTTLALFVEG
jgi:hypothetical protein